MRWLLIMLSLWLTAVVPTAAAQGSVPPPDRAASEHHGAPGERLWQAPTEGRDEGVWFVELAVWSTNGAPTITITTGGEQRTRRLNLTEVGVYSATFPVPHGRLLPVEIRVGNGPRFDDLVVLHNGDQRHSWLVTEDGRVQRSSSPVSQESMAIQEAMFLGGGALWILIVSLIIVLGRLEREGRAIEFRMPEPIWLLVWLGLAVAWTWPSALSNDDLVVGRHFDTPGTLWVIGAANRLLGTVDSFTAWPLGGDISRLDSYLLVPIAIALQSLGTGKIFGLIGIVGVAVNAWSATHFAKAVGAKQPWTMLAGFGYGFCGMAATSLLEGHVYQVFNPWLPWFGACLWRASGESGTRRQSIAALILFVLCWLTTAYVGVIALAMAAALLLQSKQRPKELMIGAAVFMVAYVLYYMQGTAPSREELEPLNPMSAHMSGLLAATPEIDRAEHSMAPIVFGWMLGLVVLGTKVLPKGRWRALMWSGFGAVVASMIPQFAASHNLILVPANLSWVTGPVAGFLRFPVRWAWLWSLCGGVVAARVATHMAPRWGWRGILILGVVVAEAFMRIGTPYRQEFRYIAGPAQLDDATGPVLELLPVVENRGVNHERWMANFSCLDQLSHGRAIAEDCVHSKPHRMRQHLNFWLQDLLLSEQPDSVAPTLSGLGFKSVMLRPDLFLTQDASLMEAELRSVDSDPTVVRENGVHALVFSFKGKPSDDPKELLRTIRPPENPRLSRRQWIGDAHHGRYNGVVALGSWFVIALSVGVAVRRR
ncbi:MAG: hypothetical protein VX944_04560 [Myxococcota bacterium]|nr:hypothetical protein [Myxococcota bacterium]